MSRRPPRPVAGVRLRAAGCAVRGAAVPRPAASAEAVPRPTRHCWRWRWRGRGRAWQHDARAMRDCSRSSSTGLEPVQVRQQRDGERSMLQGEERRRERAEAVEEVARSWV